VKVISGVSGGVEVSDHTSNVRSAENRDLSDQWEDVGSSISE
jgi:hypothetical protein